MVLIPSKGGGGGVSTYTITVSGSTYTGIKTATGATISKGTSFSSVFDDVMTDIGTDPASIELAEGTFVVDTLLTFTKSNITIKGQGMGVTILSGSTSLAEDDVILQVGEDPTNTSFNINDGTQDDATITLDMGTQEDNFTVGDFIFVRSDLQIDTSNANNKRGEFHKVTAVTSDDTGVITLDCDLMEDYDTVSTVSPSVKIADSMIENLTFQDFTITDQRTGLVTQRPFTNLWIKWAYNVNLSRVQFDDVYRSGCHVNSCWKVRFVQCDFNDIRTPESIETDLHYGGVANGGSLDVTVVGSSFYEVRHAFSLTTGARNGTEESGELRGFKMVSSDVKNCSSSAFDTHQGVIKATYIACTAEGTSTRGLGIGGGVGMRSPVIAIGLSIRNMSGNQAFHIYEVNNGADGSLIMGCEVDNCLEVCQVDPSVNSADITWIGNRYTNIAGGIYDIDAASSVITRWKMIGESADTYAGSGYIDVDSPVDLLVQNVTMSNAVRGVRVTTAATNVRVIGCTFNTITTPLEDTASVGPPSIIVQNNVGLADNWRQLPRYTTAGLPGNGEGAILYDDTTNTVKFNDGSTWANI